MSVFLGGVWRAPGGRGEPPAAVQADFRAGVSAVGVTVSRASGGTRFNSAGNLEEVTSTDSQRVDFNPANLTVRGLLVEPTRTNIFTDPRHAGVLVNVIDAAGLTPTLIGAETRRGVEGAAIQWTGTGTGGVHRVRVTTLSSINPSGATSQATLFTQVAAGSWSASFLAAGLRVRGTGSAGTITLTSALPSGAFARLSGSGALTAGSRGIELNIQTTASQAVDVTLWFGGLQVEETADPPSSLILPPVGSPAASTRAVETATLAAPNGSYDALIQDNAGAEWRLAETVSGGAYALVPRAGQPFFHIARARLFPAGVLSAAQRAALEVPA